MAVAHLASATERTKVDVVFCVSPTQVLYLNAQGNQIAASGIDVWNPSFDVTPAELITGKRLHSSPSLLILNFPKPMVGIRCNSF